MYILYAFLGGLFNISTISTISIILHDYYAVGK